MLWDIFSENCNGPQEPGGSAARELLLSYPETTEGPQGQREVEASGARRGKAHRTKFRVLYCSRFLKNKAKQNQKPATRPPIPVAKSRTHT